MRMPWRRSTRSRVAQAAALTALAGCRSGSHVSGIAEVIDLEPSLVALARRGLVVSSQSRYLLSEGVSDYLRRTEDLKPWVNRAITYFTAWAERYRRSPSNLLEESEALLRVQECAIDTRRWGEVLHLGRLFEGALIVGARWGAWAVTLDRCLTAAKSIGDRPAEAWTLHEMGTRAVCLGEADKRARSGQAMKLREAMGDDEGAAASRRNLAFALAPASDLTTERPQRSLNRCWISIRFERVSSRRFAHRRQERQPRGARGFDDRAPWRSRLSGDIARGYPGRRRTLPAWAPFFTRRRIIQRSAPRARSRFYRRRRRSSPACSGFPLFPIASSRVNRWACATRWRTVRVSGSIRTSGRVGALGRNCVSAKPSQTTTYMLTAVGTSGESTRQTTLVLVGNGAWDKSHPREAGVVPPRSESKSTAVDSSPRLRWLSGTGRASASSLRVLVRSRPAVPSSCVMPLTAPCTPALSPVSGGRAREQADMPPGRAGPHDHVRTQRAHGRDNLPVRQQLVIVVGRRIDRLPSYESTGLARLPCSSHFTSISFSISTCDCPSISGRTLALRARRSSASVLRIQP